MDANRWALLLRPSANRVYADASLGLLAAELAVLDATRLGGVLTDVGPETRAGVPYLGFTGPALHDDPAALAHLGLLSSAYALFRVRDDGALLPVELPRAEVLDDDLVTIPKYVGKTNEVFTRLLLNVTAWASASGDRAPTGGLAVLDPMCGRGTTLHLALLHGHHAGGVEVDAKDVEAHATFLRTWLKRKRLKHEADLVPVRRGGKVVGRRLEVELAPTKEAWKAGDRLRLRVVQDDTVEAGRHWSGRSFDVLVTDAPYGVQHGSHARRAGGGGGGGAALARSPLGLLEEALPGWLTLLRPGAAVGIAWNTHVAPREDAVAVLRAAGLEVLDDGPWRGFRHRVDQAIDRDVLVARLPR